MYRNLNTQSLGITGRQSELIELALTYKFRGLDLHMGSILRRARKKGVDAATRFVSSANMKVGEFHLAIDWLADDAAFRSSLEELNEIAEIAAALGVSGCTATVKPASHDRPYNENFELHRVRFGDAADILGARGIKLGIGFLAAPAHREGYDNPFIHDAESLLTLIKTVGSPHVALALDVWNWHVGGGGMDQIRDLSGDQIASLRLADIPAEVDVADITDDQRYLPSEGGVIDCAAILRLLAEKHYEGPVAVYPHPSRFSGMTRDAIVQQVSARLDQLWITAGLGPDGKLAAAPAETDSSS